MNLNWHQFEKLARTYNVIPLFEEMPADLDTPVTAFLKIRGKKYDFLFESVLGGEKWARYSFLGTDPQKIFELKGDQFKVIVPGQGSTSHKIDVSDPLALLRREFCTWKVHANPDLPRFFGGFVGYMGYGMVHHFEAVPPPRRTQRSLPDLTWLLVDQVVIFDNLAQVMKLVCVVCVDAKAQKDLKQLKRLYVAAQKRVQRLRAKLAKPHGQRQTRRLSRPSRRRQTASLSKSGFIQMVNRAKEYIAAGDIFQVVLSNRFVLSPVPTDPFSVYRSLRRLNPSPYMYYLKIRDLHVVGASPEILVRLEDGRIDVRPIAGTRRRGVNAKEDQLLEQELLLDPKELSEHIMLVDLGRNDVGRVSKTATVRVDEQKIVERYSHVMHLVSHVSGKIRDDCDAFDVIRACFPAGTLSGAPKIRAMQIIRELEPVERGLYGGAVGYVSFTGNADLAIAIRTAVIQGKTAVVQAGAGIVYNSVPQNEYEESVNKAKGMIEAIWNS